MLRFFLPAAVAVAASAAAAGDVPVLPVTTTWVKAPTAFDVGGPVRSTAAGGVQPRAVPEGAGASPLATRTQASAAGAAVPLAGLTARERAILAARIEAELASRTR